MLAIRKTYKPGQGRLRIRFFPKKSDKFMRCSGGAFPCRHLAHRILSSRLGRERWTRDLGILLWMVRQSTDKRAMAPLEKRGSRQQAGREHNRFPGIRRL